MSSQGTLHGTDVEDYHESEDVVQTIEFSNDFLQRRRFSHRILAASVVSLPVFERSPAPSPPPREERNGFQEEQRVKNGTTAPQKVKADRDSLR